MSVKLRLARAGTHKRPYHWIVASDTKSPRDGRFLEKLGTINPRAEKKVVNIKIDRVNHWLDVGALPSDAVKEILRGEGLLKARAEAKKPVSSEAPAGEESGA